jgi:hypothetical protein
MADVILDPADAIACVAVWRPQLTTRRDTAHRGAFGGQRDPETRPRPSADLADEERLVCREPFRVESR